MQESQPNNIRKVALTSLAGTSIEWYDFFLYGTAAAIIFPKAFFPADMPAMVALIASFSTFAVGFLARPLGGIVFGHFAFFLFCSAPICAHLPKYLRKLN